MDLSVIIPAYNMQGSIAACLRSVTRCPGDSIEMECLVVDGGSTDETATIVKRYIQRDKRIKLIAGEKGSVSALKNLGVEKAGGKYILFLDEEDRLCEDAWEQIEAAVDEAYADFMAFSHIVVYTGVRQASVRKTGGSYQAPARYGQKKMKFLARMLPITGVVSTDKCEAERFMKTDSAYSTCCGKLFRSDIVKNCNITFQTDLMPEGGQNFAREYFGHCESFMMTKAMIVYHMDDGILRLQERIKQWFINHGWSGVTV